MVRSRSALLGLWAAAMCGLLALTGVRPVGHESVVRAWVLGYMAFPVTAALLLARRPGNVVGRVLAVVAVGAVGTMTSMWFSWTFLDAAWSPHLEVLGNLFGGVMFGGLVALLHVFPTGRPLSRAWSGVFVASIAFLAVGAAAQALGVRTLAEYGRANPFALDLPLLETVSPLLEQAQFGVILLGVVVLVLRYRRSGTAVRAQLRWFLAGTAVLVAFSVVYSFLPDSNSPLAMGVAAVAATAGLWSLPLAVLVAVTRYRLYDIDRIVSRTVTYSAVAAVLGVVYVGSIVALQAALDLRSDLSIAASTLLAAVLFTPVRRHVRRALDRRFHRSAFDARLVVHGYAQRLRQTEQLDLDAVVAELAGTVRRTLQPTTITVQLRPPAGKQSA